MKKTNLLLAAVCAATGIGFTTSCGSTNENVLIVGMECNYSPFNWTAIKEDEYIVDGSAKLDVISELIGVNMESEEFDSVGGLLIGELGRFPEQNEEITLNNIKFTVEEIDKNRVKKVRIFT